MEQGLPYYERFVSAFPTVDDLAGSSEERVLRLWQGLGYYSRARNLHATAQFICQSLEGKFPDSYEGLLKLKGVGPYTAAAISSICFNEPQPVVDGNVFRFASRYFGITSDIAKSATRKVFEQELKLHISHEDPGAFNQAMMEFGSTVCSPKANCNECPFQSSCFAFDQQAQSRLPVKSKTVKVTKRYFHYLVVTDGTHYLMKPRTSNIWKGLYDFPLLEGEHVTEDVLNHVAQISPAFTLEEVSAPMKHILSHQRIMATFYLFKADSKELRRINDVLGGTPFSEVEILNLPKPKLIVNYLQRLSIKS